MFIAMFETLFITFREGLEAFLMVAVATLYLRKTDRHALISGVRTGLAVAVAGSVALGTVLARIGSLSPVWEGSLALLAAAAVLWSVTYMLRMGKHMGSEISAGLGQASVLDGDKAWWSVFGFTLFMVGREGVETATMLATLAGNSEMRQMTLGGSLGLGMSAVVALLWVKYGRRVKLSRFFNVTAVFMVAFASLLMIKSLHEFTEVGLIPVLDNAYWHDVTKIWVDGIYAQIASVLLVLAPTVWLSAAHWLDHKCDRATVGSAA